MTDALHLSNGPPPDDLAARARDLRGFLVDQTLTSAERAYRAVDFITRTLKDSDRLTARQRLMKADAYEASARRMAETAMANGWLGGIELAGLRATAAMMLRAAA